MKYLIYALIRIYQWVVSPVIHTICGPSSGCRFTPSCSQYFLQAVMSHGAARGSLLGVKRICRCRPRGGFGHDPVPEELSGRAKSRASRASDRDDENSGGQCKRSALYHSPANHLNFSAGNDYSLNNRHHG
jgi:putative membrane protein insertion efficiency factor